LQNDTNDGDAVAVHMTMGLNGYYTCHCPLGVDHEPATVTSILQAITDDIEAGTVTTRSRPPLVRRVLMDVPPGTIQGPIEFAAGPIPAYCRVSYTRPDDTTVENCDQVGIVRAWSHTDNAVLVQVNDPTTNLQYVGWLQAGNVRSIPADELDRSR